MLHYHHHTEVLHHSWVCPPVWKFTDRSPMVWCHVRLCWTYSRQHLRKSKKESVDMIINLVVQVNFLVRITSVVDVTTFGSARAHSDWSVRVENSSNASRRFSRNVTCFSNSLAVRLTVKYKKQIYIFMASVFITEWLATDGVNHWQVTCFC